MLLEEKKLNHEKILEVGKILKNKRIEKSLSIVDVAVSLNLNAKYIRMVEEGMVDNLSENVFYFGYISAISKFLEMDQREILSYLSPHFRKIKIGEKKEEVKNNYFYIKNAKSNNNFKYKIEIFLLTLLVFLILLLSRFFLKS